MLFLHTATSQSLFCQIFTHGDGVHMMLYLRTCSARYQLGCCFSFPSCHSNIQDRRKPSSTRYTVMISTSSRHAVLQSSSYPPFCWLILGILTTIRCMPVLCLDYTAMGSVSISGQGMSLTVITDCLLLVYMTGRL